ncbi:prophage regulatory protein [Pseudomonas oryzihabitans]
MSKPAQSASSATERAVLGNRLLRRREVELKTGKSRASIYADIRAGTFPEPVCIGRNSVAWVETELEAWISARLADRDQASASS